MSLSLNLEILILHRLRNKFLQHILISVDSASWELHQSSRRICDPMKNPKVETRSRDSNSGLYDCEADALPHDHGQPNLMKTPQNDEELEIVHFFVETF